MDRVEPLGRARELVPTLRQRAALTEELRRLPKETVSDLHAAGIMRAAQPKRYCGSDLDYEIVLEIAYELGKGCGPTAWRYSIWASHNWVAGMYSEKTQEEYGAGLVNTVSSTSLNPSKAKNPSKATVSLVDGGGPERTLELFQRMRRCGGNAGRDRPERIDVLSGAQSRLALARIYQRF